MSLCDCRDMYTPVRALTEVERLEKEFKTKRNELHYALVVATARCNATKSSLTELQAKFNAINLELGPILPSASQSDKDITVPASVVEVLRKVLFE